MDHKLISRKKQKAIERRFTPSIQEIQAKQISILQKEVAQLKLDQEELWEVLTTQEVPTKKPKEDKTKWWRAYTEREVKR